MLNEIDYTQYKGWLREATKQDLIDLAPRLRVEDQEEVVATSGWPPQIVLPHFVGPNTFVIGVPESDTPEMVMGYAKIDEHAALIWMLSSPVIYKYPQRFAPASKAIIAKMHEHYPVLTNFIDARNTRHIKWLQWLGFKLIRRVDEFGPLSLPFYEFYSYRERS